MKSDKTNGRLTLPLLCLLFAFTAAAQPSGRVCLNENWKFHKGDYAAEDSLRLSYDSIRPWILPASDPLLPPEKRHGRPVGEPDGGPFASPGFDDSSWRTLDLPHDWGIEGPFCQEYPGETGKLPWWGQAWYRKTIRMDAGMDGKRVFLELDGAMSCSSVW